LEYLNNCSLMIGILKLISGFVNVHGCGRLDSPTFQPYHLIEC